MNMNSDQAFLSLLSSQRELLNRLNMESMPCRASKNTVPSNCKPSVLNSSMDYYTNYSIADNVAERRSSLDTITSKRFSMSFGCDSLSFGFIPCDGKIDPLPYSWKDSFDFAGSKRKKASSNFTKSTSRKKRRMSSIGFVSPLFFEDISAGTSSSIPFEGDENEPVGQDQVEEEGMDQEEVLQKEITSTGENGHITKSKLKNQDIGDVSDEEDESQKVEDEEVGDEDARECSALSEEVLEFDHRIFDSETFRKTMEAFHKSMELSQNSQQAIHDWDRKMGLKRSHSKTMRQSSRSRKKLKAIMKKEIHVLGVKCQM